MKYYFIKFTESVSEGFGGEACGPFIRLRPKYSNDQGLLEHEKTHVRQWYVATIITALVVVGLGALIAPLLTALIGVAPFSHSLLYKYARPYRQWCEVRAYRKQVDVGGYNSNEFAVAALVERYGLRLSVDEARALLAD